MSAEPKAGERGYFGSMLARYVIDADDYDAARRYAFEFEAGDHAARNYHFATAFAAARTGLIAEAAAHQIAMVEHAGDGDDIAPILSAEIDGLVSLHHGEVDRGIELLTHAAVMEEALPFDFGPPEPAKPAFELLGESLVELGRMEEAGQAFRKQLTRTPNRTASLAGLATTARELGDNATATEASAKLASIQTRQRP
jgi:hypothetical protein